VPYKPSRAFFEQPPADVALQLLGAVLLVRNDGGGEVGGVIVETEAYLAQNDPAAHHFTRGHTKATAAKFMNGGTLYIHSIHRHFCMDVVTQSEGVPSSVLIRALEPLIGIDVMQQRRITGYLMNLTSGPGKLTQALAIDSKFNCQDILAPSCNLNILLPKTPLPLENIAQSRRIGLTQATQMELRFFIKENAHLSRKNVHD